MSTVLLRTGVYSITNTTNGKVYIGSTAVSFRRRWYLHLYDLRRGSHQNIHLQNAFDRDGEAALVFAIIVRCPPEQCVEQEQLIIDKVKSANREIGYNLSPTAGSPLGSKRSDEFRQQRAAAARTHWANPEIRAKYIASAKARSATAEGRAQMKRKSRKAFATAEAKARHRDNQRRAMDSPDVVAKMSQAQLRRFQNPEERRKRSEAARRGSANPITKEKMAAAKRGRTLSLTTRMRMSLAQGRRLALQPKREESGPAVPVVKLSPVKG